jgi:alpha-beta hydrolase superfamily lysophospholipase
MADYSSIDGSEALWYIFYPRTGQSAPPADAFDVAVPVADQVFVSCRFYVGEKTWPWILFFHGNGEIVSDYDGIAPVFVKNGLNLVVADYRGYGASTGTPTLTDLFKDAHVIFKAAKEALDVRGYDPSLWVMGRSLGSLSAIELASRRQDEIRGLIIESGFANVLRIMIHLGQPIYAVDFETIDKESLEVLRTISLPTLIIHGEEDRLVPLKEAETIYNHIGAKDKRLVVIPGADHNDIMFVGLKEYFKVLREFVGQSWK